MSEQERKKFITLENLERYNDHIQASMSDVTVAPTMVLSTVDSGLENAIWLEIDDE